MFSLYHSLQKQFIILSRAVFSGEQSCLVHAYLFEAIYRALPVGIRLDVTQHLCFQATIFGALSCFIHEGLICEIMFTKWITSNFSCKYHGVANGIIVEHWSNLGQYFPKKERKSRYRSNAYHFADKFAYKYVTRRFSNAHLKVWLFNYPRNLVFFQPEV